MFRSRQRGFTLIELVVVIVILGILAAFAVPRFMGLETQARVASVNAMSGTLRSSAAMSHGVWMASGSPATIPVDGQNVTMTNGYPDLLTLTRTIQDTSGFTYTPADGRFVPTGARNAARCFVQYVPAPAGGNYSLLFPNGNAAATTPNAATAQATLRNHC